MPNRPWRWFLIRVITASSVFPIASSLAWAEPPASSGIEFNRDIRPILSNKCFHCHGPDEGQRQAGLRLDEPESARTLLDSGVHAIVPGDPGASELIARVTSDSEFVRMPPPEADKDLTPREVELLKQWIADGAEYQGHWSFVAPTRPTPPDTDLDDWAHNPIDRFVAARLESAGLEPQPEADRRTFLRRLSLNLTGLPPTPEELAAYEADTSPGADLRQIERLMASTRYGEHQARFWLDAVRYADTHGLHFDNYREIWPYRDWVVRAINENLPFDEFVTWQLAGDLLPEPTPDQLIASGYNRCNISTNEGGSIDEELLVRYASDRAEVFGTVFLGLTVGCAACHSHKFDPISQTEFYELYAFFNNLDENPRDGNKEDPPPTIRVPQDEHRQQLAELAGRRTELEKRRRERLAEIEYVDPGPDADSLQREPRELVWIDDTLPEDAEPNNDRTAWQFVDKPAHSGKKSLKQTYANVGQSYFTKARALIVGQDDVLFGYVWLDAKKPPREIMFQWNTGGWKHRAYWGENLIQFGTDKTTERVAMGELPEQRGEWVRLEVPCEAVGLEPGDEIQGWAFTQYGGTAYFDTAGLVTGTPQASTTFASQAAWEQFHRSVSSPLLSRDLARLVKLPAEKRNETQAEQVREYFLSEICTQTRDEFVELRRQADQIAADEAKVNASMPTTLVAKELTELRPSHLLERGDYQLKKEQVFPGVPAALPPLESDGVANRLDLAEWLTRPDHPLLARVTVNRIWQQYFGFGLVKTSEDFGSQGDWPTHPALLDWLATELIDSGWDQKHIHELIVSSATYRQASTCPDETRAADPDNRLLARGPRFRLPAETIRDSALYTSGLLIEKVGGPPVKPYQPPGLWEAVGYTSSNTAKFSRDTGEALYRRSLYTFLKRTAPPPGMTIFDAPNREACTVRRSRTNTPLQALNLLNDEQYVEAARHLAARMLTEGGDTPESRIDLGFELVTGRTPTARERQVMVELTRTYEADFAAEPEAAAELLRVGESENPAGLDPVAHAAWTVLGNLLLNLDETITQR